MPSAIPFTLVKFEKKIYKYLNFKIKIRIKEMNLFIISVLIASSFICENVAMMRLAANPKVNNKPALPQPTFGGHPRSLSTNSVSSGIHYSRKEPSAGKLLLERTKSLRAKATGSNDAFWYEASPLNEIVQKIGQYMKAKHLINRPEINVEMNHRCLEFAAKVVLANFGDAEHLKEEDMAEVANLALAEFEVERVLAYSKKVNAYKRILDDKNAAAGKKDGDLEEKAEEKVVKEEDGAGKNGEEGKKKPLNSNAKMLMGHYALDVLQRNLYGVLKIRMETFDKKSEAKMQMENEQKNPPGKKRVGERIHAADNTMVALLKGKEGEEFRRRQIEADKLLATADEVLEKCDYLMDYY